MAFSFTVNQSPATGALAMYNLIAKLIAQGWLKKSDSDGTTYSATGVQVTGGGSGANGLANDKAWVRLQRPDGGAEFTIQRQTAGNQNWRVKYVEGATFNAGAPDAVTTPSNAVEGIAIGGGTDAAPTFTAIFGTDNSYRQQLGADAATPYSFWMACYPSLGSACNAGWVYEPLTQTAAGDTSPYWVYISGSGSGDPFSAANMSASGTRGRSYVGTITTAHFLGTFAMQVQEASGNVLFPFGAGLNPFTSKDDGCPIQVARPVGETAPTAYKGVTTILRWHGTIRALTGDTAALSVAKDRIIFTAVSLPWDSATVPS